MTRRFLPELQRDTFTYVGIRVCIRYISYMHRKKPPAPGIYPPGFVLALAEKIRMLFPALYGPMVFIAKALSQGYSMAEIRFMSVEPAPRTLHKRRPY